jgi:hypothetical protein
MHSETASPIPTTFRTAPGLVGALFFVDSMYRVQRVRKNAWAGGHHPDTLGNRKSSTG